MAASRHVAAAGVNHVRLLLPRAAWRPARACRAAALALLFAFGAPTQAGTVREADGRIVVSGFISPEDASTVLGLVGRNPGLNTVLFRDCTGGTLGAARAFATVIADRKLKTLAGGQCSSACALAYLSSPSRRFEAQPGLSLISLHAPRRADSSGPSAEEVNQQMLRWLVRATDGKLSRRILDLVSTSWSPSAGVVFVNQVDGAIRTNRTVYCDGTQGGALDKCTILPGIDALSQGIVTE